jgi:hypothetical protein
MKKAVTSKRLPAWLRGLGWVCFCLLGLATLLLATRWWLMEVSHQTAKHVVDQGEARSKASPRKGSDASAQPEPPASRGTPLVELPVVGAYLGGDSQEKRDLLTKLNEMREFLKHPILSESRTDGMLSFRTLLAKMGSEVPEGMTEAEAAAEFLKQADRFSGLLTQWRAAVEAGPWEFGHAEYSGRKTSETAFLSYCFQDLLGTMVEARLRTGDPTAAWSDWQTMSLSAERSEDNRSISAGQWAASIRNGMFRAARAGMELDAWTDDQLEQISKTFSGENALASVRRDVEGDKTAATDSFSHLRDNDSTLTQPFLHTESHIESMFNSIGVALTSDQQIADNLAVLIQRLEQPLTRFDPDTGLYIPPSTEDPEPSADPDHSGLSFDRYYFMYSDLWGGPSSFKYITAKIIKNQSAMDQSRIAAALEIQKRATGEYPETLDAVSGTFGGPMPIDIATGKPYFYQRDGDAGYTLWGAGADGKSDGGNEKTDVTWRHRPLRSK